MDGEVNILEKAQASVWAFDRFGGFDKSVVSLRLLPIKVFIASYFAAVNESREIYGREDMAGVEAGRDLDAAEFLDRRQHKRYAMDAMTEVVVEDGTMLFRGAGAGYQRGGVLRRDSGASAAAEGNEGGDGLQCERSHVSSGGDREDDSAGIGGGISIFKCECANAVGVGGADRGAAAAGDTSPQGKRLD